MPKVVDCQKQLIAKSEEKGFFDFRRYHGLVGHLLFIGI